MMVIMMMNFIIKEWLHKSEVNSSSLEVHINYSYVS